MITRSGCFFPKDRKTLAVALPTVNKGLPATYIEARDEDVVKPGAIAKYHVDMHGEPYFAPLGEDDQMIGRKMNEPSMVDACREWTFFNRF